jgi:hypothetical protein
MPATYQLEALKLLANAAQGCTVPFLLDHGCSVAALRHLARRRLAITDRVPVLQLFGFASARLEGRRC